MTDLIELGKRAAACKHWRWMPGMLDIDGNRFASDDGERRWWWLSRSATNNTISHDTPDLSDPATVGCLLSLVREAWGADYIVQFGGWTHVAIYPKERALAAWAEGDNVATEWDSFLGFGLDYNEIKSEAEALVAALDAAPSLPTGK